MDKAEVEKNILEQYPKIKDKMQELIELCLDKVSSISIKNQDWIKNNDVRFSIYGKYVSVFNATRILLFNNINFCNQKNWVSIYNSEFSIAGRLNDFVYIKEMDTQLRFASFMSFISEFEASLLIIIRFLKTHGENCASDYYNFIINNLKIDSHSDFLRMIKHLRNTIHNNGFHIPDNPNYNVDHISFNGLDFNFQKGKAIDLSWADCASIYKELISLTEMILNKSIILKYHFINDIVEV